MRKDIALNPWYPLSDLINPVDGDGCKIRCFVRLVVHLEKYKRRKKPSSHGRYIYNHRVLGYLYSHYNSTHYRTHQTPIRNIKPSPDSSACPGAQAADP